MSEFFADRLLDAIKDKKSPICVGIDPILDLMPDTMAASARKTPNDAEPAIDAIFDFTMEILRVVADHVPCVKFQSAYFEKYLWEGVEAYYSLVQEASEMGLLVIGDVKRGDIGSTVSAYAAGHLADAASLEGLQIATPDAITVNPFCGLDTLEPLVQTARTCGKGIFVLVRTSNPGSALLQDAPLADGRTWSQMLAENLNTIALSEGLVGPSGYSAIGAVVGATQPQTMQSLRKLLPHSIFLLPGYGTQGATGEMTQAAFENGRGAIVSASRSILYAHREKKYAQQFGDDWKSCVRQAVLDMKDDVGRFITGC